MKILGNVTMRSQIEKANGMSGYNKKYYLDLKRGLTEEAEEEFLEELDSYGPYACIDWDEYSNSCYSLWLFSDPNFMIEGCEDQPWTLEGELYKYGNQHYLAIAQTIKTMRTAFFTDDEIYDFFVSQGERWFGDAGGGALMERCIKHVNGGKYFEMPVGDDFYEVDDEEDEWYDDDDEWDE